MGSVLVRGSMVIAIAVGLPAMAVEPKFEVQIKKAFMTKYQDLTSIDASMTVRHSHPHPNKVEAGSDDGDLHFSGEAKEVGLPFVAEVVNAWQEDQSVAFIKQTAKDNTAHPAAMKKVEVHGAWRLWFEHPSASQIQGGDNKFSPDTTNPDHSFEIHPVFQVGSDDVHDSFGPVFNKTVHPPDSFDAYSADVAFKFFDSCSVLIKASGSGVAIRSKKLKYNYVQFVMELNKKPKKVADGYIATANVTYEDDGEETTDERRMIVVAGTEGAKAMSTADAGDTFHVLGVPRVNLNAVAALVKKNGTTQFKAQLPWEMIIVGIYPK